MCSSSGNRLALLVSTLSVLVSADTLPCWLSPVFSSENNSTNDLQSLNDDFTERSLQDNLAIQMYPNCLFGAEYSVSLEYFDTPLGKTIFSNEATDGDIALNFSLAAITSAIDFQDEGDTQVTVWFRVVVCDGEEIVYCNPFVDMPSWASLPLATDLQLESSSIAEELFQSGVTSSPWVPMPESAISWDADTLRYDAHAQAPVVPKNSDRNSFEFIRKAPFLYLRPKLK